MRLGQPRLWIRPRSAQFVLERVRAVSAALRLDLGFDAIQRASTGKKTLYAKAGGARTACIGHFFLHNDSAITFNQTEGLRR